MPFEDAERATEFYRDVFGWQIMAMPEFNYHGVATGPVGDQGMPSEPGYIGGGMFKRQEGAPSTPVITIDVDDIDAMLTEIETKGGSTVEKKIPVGEMGFAPTSRIPRATSWGSGSPHDQRLTRPAATFGASLLRRRTALMTFRARRCAAPAPIVERLGFACVLKIGSLWRETRTQVTQRATLKSG